MSLSIPVLMYHAIETPDQPSIYKDPGDRAYAVSLNEFREQMRYLKEQNFQVVLLHDILAGSFLENERTVVISFDDGHCSDALLALPVLKEFGYKAEFFITTEWIDQPGYMTTQQVQQLSASGMGIGGHGKSHHFLEDLNYDDALEEMAGAQQHLTNITGVNVRYFSAPGGRTHRDHQLLCKAAKIQCSLSSTVGLWDGVDCLSVPRVAIMQLTDIETFAKICSANQGFYRQAALRYKLLKIAKQLLGNARYERWRTALFSVNSA